MADVKFERVKLEITSDAQGATYDVTIAGFGTVKGAIIYAVGDGGPLAQASFGFYDGTTQRTAGVSAYTGQTTTMTDREARSAVSTLPYNAASRNIVSAVSFIPNGIQLQSTTRSSLDLISLEVVLIGGADVINIAVGNTTAAASIDINVGFEPTIVQAASCSIPEANLARVIATLSYGVAINDVGLTQKSVGYSSVNAVTETVVNGYLTSDKIIGVPYGDSVVLESEITAYSATGFTLQTTIGAGANIIEYIAIELAIDADVALFDTEIPSTGNYSETGAGFTPSYGLFIGQQGVARNVLGTSAVIGSNLASFDGNGMSSQTISLLDAVGTTVDRSIDTDTTLAFQDRDYNNGNYVVGSSPSFTSTGWDFTLTTNPTTPLLGFGFAIGPGGAAPTIAFDGPNVVSVAGTDGTPLPDPTPDPSMDSRFTVTGGTATYALAPTSGALPAGVTIDSATGNLVGTPSADGTFAGVIVRGTVT